MSKGRFPFGEKNFVGIIKFYNEDDDFGFIISNNHGMDGINSELFNRPNIDFYINKKSGDVTLGEHSLVIFRPYIQGNGKLKAKNVRDIDFSKDYDLINEYYHTNNIIETRDKKKVRDTWRSFHYEYSTIKFDIYSFSTLKAAEKIKGIVDTFSKDRDYNSLKKNIDDYIKEKGGDADYWETIRYRWNNMAEKYFWKVLFTKLDDNESLQIITKHNCLVSFAPVKSALKFVDKIDNKYINDELSEQVKIYKKHLEAVKLEEDLDNNINSKSLEELKDILRSFDGLLSSKSVSKINERIGDLVLEKISKEIEAIKTSDSRLLYLLSDISRYYLQLSEKKRERFHNELRDKLVDSINLNIKDKLGNDLSNSHAIEDTLEYFFGKNPKRESKLLWMLPGDSSYNNEILELEDIVSPREALIEKVKSLYRKAFMRQDAGSRWFYDLNTYEQNYSYILPKDVKENLIKEIREEVFKKGKLGNIALYCRFIDKKIPKEYEYKFLEYPLEYMIGRLDKLSLFEDNGKSLLPSIVDKIIQERNTYWKKHEEEQLGQNANNIAANIDSTDEFPF